MPINIHSDDQISIEQHFRIKAGPGAGKTHWLVNHIKNVLQTSKRLGCYRKIACITYTNIAVETILKRLGIVADRVEVSTIHSFLYHHLLKPYLHFIADEFEFNIKLMDGHDDHFISFKNVNDWIDTHPNKSSLRHPYTPNQLTRLDNNKEALKNWLSSIHYEFNASGELKCVADNGDGYYMVGGSRRNLAAQCLNHLATDLLGYKKIFWRKGTLHHDDVLFFGFTLMQRYPFIITILRAKFPYFFIDEFQDTNPIQAKILNIIGQTETIIGIIGDEAQSIYGFQGAIPANFSTFSLSGLVDYEIVDNRRSTHKIIDLLNHVRTGMRQNPIRITEGSIPLLIVGKMDEALKAATISSNNEIVTSLAWDNITSNAMKKELDSPLPTNDLIAELYKLDSLERRRPIISCIKAIELARQTRFKEAIKEMERNYRGLIPKTGLKKAALMQIASFLKCYADYEKKPLMDFYHLVKSQVKSTMPGFRSGAADTFYNTNSYEQLAICVRINEDKSPHRTIHKAKGDEFDNVLLILKDSTLTFLTGPNLSTQNQRLFYVALSRARERLFINVPDLPASKEQQLPTCITVRRL